MLKAALIASGVLLSFPALGSHFLDCNLKAEVTQVKYLPRLGDVAVISHDPEVADYETVLTLKVKEILPSENEHMLCLGVDSSQDVYLSSKIEKKYKVGDEISLHYQNVGDFRASRITWNILD